MAGKKKRSIDSYSHREKRPNNPPAGLVTPATDPDQGKQTYQHDPHIDPQLQWAGKAEGNRVEVPTVSLHRHEQIDPRTIIEGVRKRNGAGKRQSGLFEEERAIPLRQEIEFYQHSHDWSNRLIAGDSLLVMNSLLQKENMAGKAQCIYIDPPYGIKYGSNFQPFVGKRDVTDGKSEDLTTEPEMIKAFRDTWELGIHSYLTYMRDRLLLSRELLADSGSCFVQIGDENVHRVSALMDEVFGAENRAATISFATTSGTSTAYLPQVAHYLLWYGKDIDKLKYRRLYEPLTRQEIAAFFNWHAYVELADGQLRPLTEEERFDPDKYLPAKSRLFRHRDLLSQGRSTTGRSEPYEWNGRKFECSADTQWSISHEDMDKLAEQRRLVEIEGRRHLGWKLYEDDVPGRRINNLWHAQMYPRNKKYVVETATKVLQRCILMTTDPGDLVIDPTCGSGTTAYVAEQWGRRWITCDTSRVALTLAKKRLMTASFDYYRLANPAEGVGGGLQYKSLDKVSPSILSGIAPPERTYLYDQPMKESKKARVTGPFTVEAVPAPMVMPVTSPPQPEPPLAADETVVRTGETQRQDDWRQELLKAGIRGKSGQRISFSRVEPLPCRSLHAEAETRPDDSGADGVGEPAGATARAPQRAVISFGPQHAPLEARQVEQALQEAATLKPSPRIIVFAAFQFDPEAAKDIDETNWPGMTILKVHMNADLQTGDLKKKTVGSEAFWLIGQPDVFVEHVHRGPYTGQWQVQVRGFDYFNTKTGELESGDEKQIAMWMLDTDYDGRSLYPSQVFFPIDGREKAWDNLAKSLRAEIDQNLIGIYGSTVSIPFPLGEHKRIAVKIVDDRGIESIKVVPF